MSESNGRPKPVERILLVTNLFPTPVDPGRGVFTLHIARALREFCDVTVICPLPWFPRGRIFRIFRDWYRFAEVPDVYEIEGITVHAPRYPMIPKVSEGFHSRLMALGLRGRLKTLLRTQRFDVINSHWLFPDSVAVDRSIEDLNLPHVATGLGCDVNKDLYDPRKRDKILGALSRCPGVTVVSQGLADHLIKNGIPETKIRVIGNGVDQHRFARRDRAAARDRLGLPAEEQMVLYVGRLDEEKDVGTLVEAFGLLAARDSGTRLYVVGDGPLRSTLEAQTTALGIAESVTFVGQANHEDVPVWMNAADIFCLPSLREGCPNVILEALASGLPVVASSVGAIPELVDGASGVLVEPQHPDQFADAIDEAVHRHWDTKNIAALVGRFSWGSTARQYWEAYRAVIDSAKSQSDVD